MPVYGGRGIAEGRKRHRRYKPTATDDGAFRSPSEPSGQRSFTKRQLRRHARAKREWAAVLNVMTAARGGAHATRGAKPSGRTPLRSIPRLHDRWPPVGRRGEPCVRARSFRRAHERKREHAPPLRTNTLVECDRDFPNTPPQQCRQGRAFRRHRREGLSKHPTAAETASWRAGGRAVAATPQTEEGTHRAGEGKRGRVGGSGWEATSSGTNIPLSTAPHATLHLQTTFGLPRAATHACVRARSYRRRRTNAKGAPAHLSVAPHLFGNAPPRRGTTIRRGRNITEHPSFLTPTERETESILEGRGTGGQLQTVMLQTRRRTRTACPQRGARQLRKRRAPSTRHAAACFAAAESSHGLLWSVQTLAVARAG